MLNFLVNEVRELATKVRTALKAGQVKPFIAVDLKKYAFRLAAWLDIR